MRNSRNPILLIVKSFVFYFLFSIFTIVYSSFCLAAKPFVSLKLKHTLISFWAPAYLWLMDVICGVEYTLHGSENLGGEPAVVMSKHQSDWETIAMLKFFNPQSTVVKKELLNIPFFGWAMRIKDPIAIDREQKTSSLKQLLKEGQENLKKGCWIVIYPEGTRITPGEQSSYSPGGALLAQKAGVSVIPLAHNAGEFCPPKKYIKYPGNIDVVIGPRIDTQGLKSKEIMAQTEAWIRKTMLEISPLEREAVQKRSQTE